MAPIWGVISQILCFASRIFYTIETVANRGLARVYLFDPIAMLIQQTRHWLVGGTPGVPALMGGSIWLLVPLGITIAMFGIGYWTSSRMAPEIAEEL